MGDKIIEIKPKLFSDEWWKWFNVKFQQELWEETQKNLEELQRKLRIW